MEALAFAASPQILSLAPFKEHKTEKERGYHARAEV